MKFSLLTFYLLLLFIPINWGLHFISKDSYALGILSDYLIPTLRFTDFLIILFVVKNFKLNFNKPLFFLIFISLIGIPFSANVPAT